MEFCTFSTSLPCTYTVHLGNNNENEDKKKQLNAMLK